MLADRRLNRPGTGNAAALRSVLVDPLTRLANHRAFHETLRAAFHDAGPQDGLALALIDVDHFKAVNDAIGHAGGDALLCSIADRLGDAVKPGDTVARVGGDEFALLLHREDGRAAQRLVEDVGRAVAEVGLPEPRTVTLSAGICDVRAASDPDTMLRLAEGALCWIKRHGRAGTCIYDARIVLELPVGDRTRDTGRSQALLGIRALARAMDAKDATTRLHSDRVAGLARRIALALGWTPERVALLESAALVHDVGKIGVPDAVLFKSGRLDPDEYAAVKRHAELGAEITRGVLAPEQVAWIRAHHERPDGQGYPDRLEGDQIPDGAAIISLADAFDVMTIPRPYARRRDLVDALRECNELIGRQFATEPVRALAALLAQGAVPWIASVATPPASTGSVRGLVGTVRNR